jgi:four helix bundle protein
MGGAKTFEDLEVWRKSRTLAANVYSLSNKELFVKDFGLKDQMRRASVSILSNIAEGFERKSNKEFLYFLNVAKASAGELRAQTYLTLDLKYLTKNEFELILNDIIEISKMLYGLMKHLETKN